MEILFYGSTGPLTKLLQKTLNRLGYNAGEMDGIFGEQTEQAVKQFQRDNGISPTGIVWPQTWTLSRPRCWATQNTPCRQGTRSLKLPKATI